ncbi:MAG: hypothetical protein GX902_11070 [Lentisphaerae bacterium]|nr:hypothetical protein [Lentisphaerota bacterium]
MRIVILGLSLVIGFQLSAAVFVERSFSGEDISAGECLQVCLTVSLSPPNPELLIVSERLPSGVRLLSACWQGQSIVGKESDGLYKWLLGWPAPLQSGLLQYEVEVQSAAAPALLWEGQVTLPDGSVQSISGQQRFFLQPRHLPAPEFSPADGSEFTDTMLVELHCCDCAGDIFFAFGADPPIADWLWYEGPFAIDNSVILQAEVWNEWGEYSARSTSRYYRRGECRLLLQPGWNWFGNGLLLPSAEQQKLLSSQVWQFCPRNRCWVRAKSIEPRQAYFIYSVKTAEVPLQGLLPLPESSAEAFSGWQPQLLDCSCTAEQGWVWLNDSYSSFDQNNFQTDRPGWIFRAE